MRSCTIRGNTITERIDSWTSVTRVTQVRKAGQDLFAFGAIKRRDLCLSTSVLKSTTVNAGCLRRDESGPTLLNLIKGSVYRVSPLVSVRVNPVKETIGLASLHKRDGSKTLKKVRVRSASCSRRPLVFITMGW